ncbi:FAD-dependent oxidoreductase [Aeromicrobium sp. Leaf350]|uniref:flavin monoamine oxidase family protein n=1 Tax=Aeromicrobium sp. Leaf350 TaxID=2876565 RepID=UPI001E2AA686|nr:FAD-dependent oxidoreductase [Aeromicrobium sp. Leaf350]
MGATVIVVGAGVSGLIAARELVRRGIDVMVVEASDRIGGRALTETSTLGSRLDLGGQWIGADHHRLMALAAELNLQQYQMYSPPVPMVIVGGRSKFIGSISILPAATALVGLALLARIGRTARWNHTTLADWLRRVPGRTSRRLLEVIALTSWTADVDRYSIHAATRMIRQQGGVRTMLSTTGGAQDSLLVEGIGGIVDRLAAELGDRVLTGMPVTVISRDEAGVTIHAGGWELDCSKVIVTAPPPIAARIEHHPPLSSQRQSAERDSYMGTVYKAIAVYDRPFWRDAGRAEALVLDNPGRAFFDTTAPGGPGHLCTLVSGPEARALDDLEPEERRRLLLGPLAPHFGVDVLSPVSWHEKSWHIDPFAGGGYMSIPEPGTTAGIMPVTARAEGHVHWAGTESADDHAGYFEGAIQAGERAALEVADALNPASTGSVTASAGSATGLSPEFKRGFRHEQANRAWALSTTTGIAKRRTTMPDGVFWASYVRLEQFNAPRYREAALRWGMNPDPRLRTRIRGAISSRAPGFILKPFLTYAQPETLKYARELDRLRLRGPRQGDEFLAYMVEQEQLQVEMMRLALAGRFADAAALVDQFIEARRDHTMFEGGAAYLMQSRTE